MNRAKEKQLVALISQGDETAKKILFEQIYKDISYIVKDYHRKNSFLTWQDLMQEAALIIHRSLGVIEYKSDARPRDYCKRAVRNDLRKIIAQSDNAVKVPYYKLRERDNNIELATMSFEGNSGFADFMMEISEVESDEPVGLRETFYDVFDQYLTLEEEDIVRLNFGFEPRSQFKEWDSVKRKYSVQAIAKMMNLTIKQVRIRLNNALEKLKKTECKIQLSEYL